MKLVALSGFALSGRRGWHAAIVDADRTPRLDVWRCMHKHRSSRLAKACSERELELRLADPERGK